MRGTIFQNILNECTLKFPSNKSLPFKAIPKVQNLAISFYTYLLNKVLKVKNGQFFLKEYKNNGQSIRESYQSVFYALQFKNQVVLDFISCLVCLVGDTLFTPKVVQENPQLEQFFETLTREDQKLREYLYIVYTFETIGHKVGKQSAELLFKRYIISQNIDQSNFRQGMKINLQLKDVKKNMESKNENIRICPRTKKRTKIKHKNEFVNEVKNIFVQNKYEIEQQKRNLKKFQRLVNKCITQGNFSPIHRLPMGSPETIAKLQEILSHPQIKNSLKNKQEQKNEGKRENNKNFSDWVKIIDKMKNTEFMSRQQVVNALSGSCHQSWPIIDRGSATQKKQSVGQRKQIKFNESKSKRTLNLKHTHENKSLFPSLSHIAIPLQKQNNENGWHSRQSSLHKGSRKLKMELSQFIEERKKRFIRN